MRKNRLLSLVMTAMMTAAAALMLSSCSDNDSSADLALKYNVSGTWHAEFDADGTVGGSHDCHHCHGAGKYLRHQL